MRLIDAEKLKEAIVADYLRGKKSLMQVIEELPTAYDVDKVVEQITAIKEKEYVACTDEECRHCEYHNDCWDGEMSGKLALDKAIRIVKGGGEKWRD